MMETAKEEIVDRLPRSRTNAFSCPHCGSQSEQRVVDSRPSTDINDIDAPAVRRRRRCTSCKGRWTSYEIRAIDLRPNDRKALLTAQHALGEAMAAVSAVLDQARDGEDR